MDKELFERDPRDFALGLVEDGMIDPMLMLTAALNWMSTRSEEHTSELQSRQYLVCRLQPSPVQSPGDRVQTVPYPSSLLSVYVCIIRSICLNVNRNLFY